MRECLKSVDLESRRRVLRNKPDLTIHMRHFDVSMQQVMPSVSRDVANRYLEWQKEFGSK